MKNITNFKSVFTLLIILLPVITFSQTWISDSSFKKYCSINLNIGPTLFFGDLGEYDYYSVENSENELRMGYGMIVNWQISPVFGLRGQLLNGKLSGAHEEIDMYFNADILEGNINTSVNFSNLFFKNIPERFFSVYGVFGIGLSNWCTKMKDLQTDEVIAVNGNGSGIGLWGRTLEGNILSGLGFDFRLNNNLSLNLEGTIHGVNSDNLDAKVSGFKYDMYSYISFGLTYKFIFKNKKSIIIEEPVKKYNQEKISLPKAESKKSEIKEIPKKVVSNKEIAEQNKEISKEKVKPKPKAKTDKQVESKTKVVKKITIPTPEIEYRVQILTMIKKASSLTYIANKYNISTSIREDFHNGCYIYTVGSFNNYEATKIYRDKLRLENKIYDAYVVVFKNGKRLNKLSELKK